MSRLETARRRARAAVIAVASLLLVGVVACLLAQIGARSLFSTGLPWSGELARFLAVWCVLLGAAAAFDEGVLHRVELVVDRLSAGGRHAAALLCRAAVAGTLVMLLVSGLQMTERAAPQLSSAMQISMAWVYAALPVVALLMLASLLADLIVRRRL